MTMTNRRFLAAFAAASLLLSCSQEKPKPKEEAIPVTVATAQQRDVPQELKVIGTVQPISTVDVRALAGGQLQKVWFQEGDDVRRGQLLFSIDPRPYQAALSQAQATLARDEAQLKQAQSELARYAGLVKQDYVTKAEYDKFMAAAESGKAVVAADRAAAENARLQLSYCEIRSPMDGRTGNLMVHLGNLVRPNDVTALVVINQVSPVYVQFSIPQSGFDSIRAHGRVGDLPVTASAPQGGAPLATGRLSFVDNVIDAATGTISLKAKFENQNRVLWPGQFVNVAMTLGHKPAAVVVPAQAVQNGQKGQYVYVVVAGNAVEMRPVSTSNATAEEVVIEKGVRAGETVVTDGQIRLTPKSKVDVKSAAKS
jgi:membrane fusion protein, multidrug efflux system